MSRCWCFWMYDSRLHHSDSVFLCRYYKSHHRLKNKYLTSRDCTIQLSQSLSEESLELEEEEEDESCFLFFCLFLCFPCSRLFFLLFFLLLFSVFFFFLSCSSDDEQDLLRFFFFFVASSSLEDETDLASNEDRKTIKRSHVLSIKFGLTNLFVLENLITEQYT